MLFRWCLSDDGNDVCHWESCLILEAVYFLESLDVCYICWEQWYRLNKINEKKRERCWPEKTYTSGMRHLLLT